MRAYTASSSKSGDSVTLHRLGASGFEDHCVEFCLKRGIPVSFDLSSMISVAMDAFEDPGMISKGSMHGNCSVTSVAFEYMCHLVH